MKIRCNSYPYCPNLLSQRWSKLDHIYVLLLDITNAFSFVPMQLVLDSLRKIGIDENIVQLIGNTMFNSEFTVKMGDNKYYRPLFGSQTRLPGCSTMCHPLVPHSTKCARKE